MWRWLSLAADQPGAPAPAGRVAYRLSEADREACARYRGNVAAVHQARQAMLTSPAAPVVLAAGVPVPASLREGGGRGLGRRRSRAAGRGVYLTRPAGHRNQTWEMDHKQLPILVMPPRGAACCPWLTTVIDDATQVLAGWAIALTPHAGTVLTAVRMALVHDPARGPFGAIPVQVRIDRAWSSPPTRSATGPPRCASTRGGCRRSDRTGREKPRGSTAPSTRSCCAACLGSGGPRDADGRLYGPLDDRFAARLRAARNPVTPLPIEASAGIFAQWASWYNTERPYDGLDGRTPLQAWQDDPGPLHRISADKLRHLLLASGKRIIGKDGIRFGSLAYIAPELYGRGGQRVQIRYMSHDDRSIEVYLDATHLCTAYPAQRLSPEQTQEYLENAARERKRLTAERRKVSVRTRAELAPLTGGGARAEESRVLPPAAADEPAARRGDALLRRKARSNLLG